MTAKDVIEKIRAEYPWEFEGGTLRAEYNNKLNAFLDALSASLPEPVQLKEWPDAEGVWVRHGEVFLVSHDNTPGGRIERLLVCNGRLPGWYRQGGALHTNLEGNWLRCTVTVPPAAEPEKKPESVDEQSIKLDDMTINVPNFLRCVIRNAIRTGGRRGVAWARVADICGVGSTTAIKLCRYFDMDPDTGKPLERERTPE